MLLVSLAQGNRDENPIVDIAKSRDDAQRLYSAGNELFVNILHKWCLSSWYVQVLDNLELTSPLSTAFSPLAAGRTCVNWWLITRPSREKLWNRLSRLNFPPMRRKDCWQSVSFILLNCQKNGLLSLACFTVQCAKSRPAYLAERIHNAISGAGTKDRALIRLIVSRCDVDLGTIKIEYQKAYGKSLAADVAVNLILLFKWLPSCSQTLLWITGRLFRWLQESPVGPDWIN
jgi:annexin A7/11